MTEIWTFITTYIFPIIAWFALFFSIIYSEESKTANHWPLLGVIIVFLLYYNTILSYSFDLNKVVFISIAYFVVGLMWSIYKWIVFVKFKNEYYLNEKDNILQKHWEDVIKQENIVNLGKRCKPLATEHKETITAWIIWWPFSVLRYLFRDFFVDIANWIFKLTSKIFDSITESVFKY